MADDPKPRSPEEEAALRTLAQILANAIRRKVDAEMKASRGVTAQGQDASDLMGPEED